MIGNQIDILIPSPSFSHNLCFKYSNGSCKLILDIYVSKTFQWYKEFFNLMNFDLWNHSLNIWDFIRTSTPKVGIHLAVCVGSFLHTLSHFWECECDSRGAFLTCTFSCPCLSHKPKVRVVTICSLLANFEFPNHNQPSLISFLYPL